MTLCTRTEPMPTKRYVVPCVTACLLGLIALLWISCTPAEKPKLKVGYLPINAAVPLFVALEGKLFDAEGVVVEPVKYQNGALLAEDVIAGRLAAASPGPGDVYLAKEAGVPGRFKIYLQTAYTPDNFIYSILVKADSGIETLADLKGKRIGVFPGVTNKRVLEILLNKEFNWIPDKDFRVQGVAPPLQLDALTAGEYDAICPLEPTGTIGSFRPGLKLIERGPIERGVLNPLYITAHCLSTDVMGRSPDAVQAFVRAIEKAVDQIRTDEAGARALLPKYTSLTAEQARVSPFGEVKKVAEASRSDFQSLADLLHREGVLSRPVKVDELYYKAP